MELLDEYSMMAPPFQHEKIHLKPHQLTLLQRCMDLECKEMEYEGNTFKTTIGIIGDKVGSGKSYTILSLIYSTLNIGLPNSVTLRSVGLDHIMIHATSTAIPINTCVLVIPHNLTKQWETYLENFGVLKSYVVNRRLQLKKMGNIDQYDVVMVTSTHYNEFANTFQNTRFKRVFFDEVDTLNIPNCSSLTANFTWFVTASYNNLVYPKGFADWNQITLQYTLVSVGIKNKGYINNIFTDLFFKMTPSLTRRIIAINRDDFVDKSFQLPEIIRQIVLCRSSNVINILNGVVSQDIIACLNAEDVISALTHVNAHNKNTEDNVVRVVLDKYNRMVHNIQLQKEYIMKCEYDTTDQRNKELGDLVTKRDDLVRKIDHIERRIRDTNLCSICLNDVEHKTITAECCQNSFCFKCITQWVNVRPVCPCCKTPLQMKDLFVVHDEATTVSMVKKPATDLSDKNDKLLNFKNLVHRLSHKKTLVFSAYDESFEQLARVLNDMSLKYMYIRGSGTHVNKIVDAYKNGDVDFLFVNAQNYGSGLNLENTTDIIIFHQFSSENTKQVIGRAQRMGRKEPLTVWYMLNENENVSSALI